MVNSEPQIDNGVCLDAIPSGGEILHHRILVCDHYHPKWMRTHELGEYHTASY